MFVCKYDQPICWLIGRVMFVGYNDHTLRAWDTLKVQYGVCVLCVHHYHHCTGDTPGNVDRSPGQTVACSNVSRWNGFVHQQLGRYISSK